jgi:hypothetical protein
MVLCAVALELKDTRLLSCTSNIYHTSRSSLTAILSYLNGKKIDYTGSKNVPAMEKFIRKAIAPGVVKVNSADEFNERLEKEDVAFLLLHSGSDRKVVVCLVSPS